MNKIYILSMFLILLISCKKNINEKVNQNDLKAYFLDKVKDQDSLNTLTEFKFIKLDTTSLKNQYIILYNNMLSKSEEYDYDFNNLLESLKSNRKLQNLSSDLDYTLYKNYKDDADDDAKEAEEILRKDSLLRYDLEKVDLLIKKADSIQPKLYTAKCYFIVKKKDRSTIKDTAYINLDLELNILNEDEFKKNIKKIYKPKSNFYNEW